MNRDVVDLLIGFAIVVLMGCGLAIYYLIPAWQCPECFSYRIEDKGESLYCRECGHEWKSE